MFLLPFVCVFAATGNQDLIDRLPDDVNRMIQDHMLHFYKFQHSPIAPILNLAETSELFSTLPFSNIDQDSRAIIYGYVVDNNDYTMPKNRYLTLYTVQQRMNYPSVDLGFRVKEGDCDAMGIYYYDGQDSQVLKADDETLDKWDQAVTLMYQLSDMPEEL